MKIIDIKSDIVDNDTALFYSFFGMDSVSPKSVSEQLSQGDPNEDIEVDIASNGGDVFAASEIYSMLKAYKGQVHVVVQGLAASAASVIAMAGDKVSIAPTAQIMIHRASVATQGNTSDLSHEAIVLDGIDESIAGAYELKTGMSQSDLLDLMSNETWLTAKKAVDQGFADEIMFVDDHQPQVVNAVSPIPSKAAVNKLMNLISKTQKPVEEPPKTADKQNNTKKDKSELKNKLALLF